MLHTSSNGMVSINGGPRVVIVGAGLAGVSTAITLKKQLHFENFTIYEKAATVGGTWRDNTYPGCGSDVPSHWYCLSTELNPNWSSYYVSQPEIRQYWEDLFDKYHLSTHTHFGTFVHSAEWDLDAQLYKLTLVDVATGGRSEVEAEVVFYAIGGFMSPIFPKDIPGTDKFCGPLWHSARWRHDISLEEKRVGVVGNGCSAAQFIPEISADPSVQVINFCRTPQWYQPRGNYRYSEITKWAFRHIPFVMRWYRNWIMARSDIAFLVFRRDNLRLLSYVKRIFIRYLKENAPKEYIKDLIPNYPPGCRRIIVDPGFLESLKRPNLSIRWDAIESVVEDGLKLKNGEVVPLDVIIFGTGYSIEPVDMRIRGKTGQTFHEYAAAHGGATAYMGSCVPGFPNLFILLGPNTATGHASVIFSQESQINHALQLLKPILDGQARSFEIKHEATDVYNTWLQGRLARSVWTECNSQYQVDRRKESKNIALFPGPVTLFWWISRRVKWDNFHAMGAEGWARQRRMDRARKQGLILAVVLVIVGLMLEGMPWGTTLRVVGWLREVFWNRTM